MPSKRIWIMPKKDHVVFTDCNIHFNGIGPQLQSRSGGLYSIFTMSEGITAGVANYQKITILLILTKSRLLNIFSVIKPKGMYSDLPKKRTGTITEF